MRGFPRRTTAPAASKANRGGVGGGSPDTGSEAPFYQATSHRVKPCRQEAGWRSERAGRVSPRQRNAAPEDSTRRPVHAKLLLGNPESLPGNERLVDWRYSAGVPVQNGHTQREALKRSSVRKGRGRGQAEGTRSSTDQRGQADVSQEGKWMLVPLKDLPVGGDFRLNYCVGTVMWKGRKKVKVSLRGSRRPFFYFRGSQAVLPLDGK